MPQSFRRSLSRHFPSWLILMGLLTAIGPLAIDMYLPAFPTIAADLNTTEGNVERTLASYLLGMGLAQLVYGPLADRYGRKKPLIFGLVLFAVASYTVAFSQDVEHLTFWRVIQAFGGAAGAVIPRAVIRDRLNTRDAAKSLSLLMLIMGATPILAPIVGAQLLQFTSWRSLFYLMTLLSAALLLATVLSMQETLDPKHVRKLHPKTILSTYKALFAHQGFFYFAAAAAFGSAGLFAYISGSARTFISVYDVPATWFSLLFGINAACLIFSSQVGARLLNYFQPAQLLRVAQNTQLIIIIISMSFALIGYMNVYGMMATLMLFMACQGIILPNASALALNEQGQRLGSASALMGTLQMFCGALAGLAVSSWQQLSALPLLTVLSLSVLISWLSGYKAQKHQQKQG